MVRCFLNIDLGELPGEPEELYALAHAASIACGGHAGDEVSMERALQACARHGTRVGAHPSYADRAGFGRRPQVVRPEMLRALVNEQCARLARLARARGLRVELVKPHGALYHAAAVDFKVARAVLQGAKDALGHAITVIGPPEGKLLGAARAAGLAYAREGFADRRLRADGTLVPRGEPGALIEDPATAAEQARRLARSGAYETLCVHGDTPGVLAIARAVRAALEPA